MTYAPNTCNSHHEVAMSAVSLSVLLAVGLSVTPQGVRPPQAADKPDSRVKSMTSRVSVTADLKGIVGSIDTDNLVLVEMSKEVFEVKEHTLKPIDLLRSGEVVYDVQPKFAYRWQDVKAGDTVLLECAEDHIDKQMYCMMIHIARRPKGRLPASQLEEKDVNFPARRVVNDIENGVDVSDEELAKVYPPRPARIENGHRIEATPGGLNHEYQAKLDAIRAKKKEAELKAQPPEKKEK